jgi:polyphenol oxidase
MALAEKALQTNQWPLQEVAGLTLVLSPLLSGIDGLIHAFTTRMGGTSEQPLQWFNLGRHWDTEQSRQDAMTNRKRLCDAFGLDADRLTVPWQQHTANILAFGGTDPHPGSHLPELDGVATTKTEYPLLLHFADCVPVIIYDPEHNALCVMHAGWRGTAGGIVSNGVNLLHERFGSNPADMLAAVGPAIGSCCYQTGMDVADQLAKTVANATPLIRRQDEHAYPDLKAINAMQLLEAGVEQVDVTNWCTACNPEIFYSHRQSGGRTGRQGAMACLK